MTKRPFSRKGQRVQECLELVHKDVCVPMNVQVRGSFKYFIMFIDNHSRYGYIYLMHHKSKAFDKFTQFKFETKEQLGKSIKALRSDRDGEYLSGEFLDFLTNNGILIQLIRRGMPQHNYAVEIRNRKLLDMVRSMLSYLLLPILFWGYVQRSATGFWKPSGFSL